MGEFVTGEIPRGYLLSRCKTCGYPADRHDKECHFISDGSTLFRVTSDIVYLADDGTEKITRAGLLSDGSSNPRFSWELLGHPFTFTRLKSSLWHDAQYRCAPPCDASIWRAIRSTTRKEIDDTYLEMMTEEGEPQKETVHRGVRWGGWLAWYRHAKRNAEGIANG